jgi:epoxyqueuosine reductase
VDDNAQRARAVGTVRGLAFADANQCGEFITATIRRLVAGAGTATQYRQPLVGFAPADDPCFADLPRVVHPAHLLPSDLLPGARSVVSFFLPFAPWVVEANAGHRKAVAREWAVAYLETNALIGQITSHLIAALAERGIAAAAEPATHNFDSQTLLSRWSHKSVAVIAGLGNFGLHQMVITDAGCAGRFGSLVLEIGAQAPGFGDQRAAPYVDSAEPRERCLYFADGSCLECVMRCPVNALDANEPLDKQRCYQRLLGVAHEYRDLGLADVCGKCAIGPCSLASAV